MSSVHGEPRILLVDDRPENLVALEAILSSLGNLVPVRSGEQAIQAVLADEYAVVLLDIMMPGMDGFETAAQIKRHGKSRDVPIIFLTAATMRPEQAFRGYAAGAVGLGGPPSPNSRSAGWESPWHPTRSKSTAATAISRPGRWL